MKGVEYMIINNSCRLSIRNVFQNLLTERRNITDRNVLEGACDQILAMFDKEYPQKIAIDGIETEGVVVPIAWMYIPIHQGIEINGKKYIKAADDWIAIFSDGQTARLLRERINVLQPNGWGDAEDYISEDTTYTTATRRDLDGIFNVLYV